MLGRGAIFQLIANRLTAGMGWRERILIIVLCAPLLLTAAALGYAVESGIFLLRSDRTTGTVVQVYEWEGTTMFDRGVVNYEPIFTYRDGDRERRASVGSAHSSFALEVGETADIRYVPGGSGNVRLATWQGLWFMPAALGVIAAITWIVAGLVLSLIHFLFFRKGTT